MAFVGVRLAVTCHGQARCRACVADRFDPVGKQYFPPPLNLLLSWTTLFRSGATLRNYLGYVKTGCILSGKPTQVGNVAAQTQRLYACGFRSLMTQP